METNSPGPAECSNMKVITRKALFDKMQQQDLPSFEAKLEFLQHYLLCEDYSEEQIKDMKHKFSYIKTQFKKRWIKARKKQDRFLKINDNWLQGTLDIPRVMQPKQRSSRPGKSFIESSERSKRRKTEELRSTIDKDILVHATQTKLHTSGNRDASKLLKLITKSPKTATKLKMAYSKSEEIKETQLTPLRATVIEKALVPIGMLSEEAAEARNKHLRLYRQKFARKFTREKCNEDVLNRLLLSSDPLLSSLRPKVIKRSMPFSKETIEMLVPAEPDHAVDDVDEDSGESSEETSDEELE